MAEKERTQDQVLMDQAAESAAKELDEMPNGPVKEVANWWKRHYLKAGHKRLAQRLLKHAD